MAQKQAEYPTNVLHFFVAFLLTLFRLDSGGQGMRGERDSMFNERFNVSSWVAKMNIAKVKKIVDLFAVDTTLLHSLLGSCGMSKSTPRMKVKTLCIAPNPLSHSKSSPNTWPLALF